MRLNNKELEWIKKLSQKYFGMDCETWIFGSRTNDNLKGGDIDIFIETQLITSLKEKIFFLNEYEQHFGEQKIDLIVKTPASANNDIYIIAKKEGIKI